MAQAKMMPINPSVLSPESFATQSVMRQTLSHLKAYVQIDFEYFAKQEAAREDFRRKMATCDPGYLKSWDVERSNQDELEQSANRLEQDWFASVNTLYAYGEQHAPQIKLKDGKISISNINIRDQFDDLLGQSKALHEKLELVVQEEVKHQKQAKASIQE